MVKAPCFLALFFFTICFKTVFSQNILSKDLEYLTKIEISKNTYPSSYKGLLKFYKKYISPQGIGSCAFSITCSNYASKSIHSKGMFLGVFATADRLCRCHPYEAKWYRINERTGRLDDSE